MSSPRHTDSDAKVRQVVLYFAAFCKDRRKVLSETLLNKYLCNIDFGHYALHDAPITSLLYKKDHYGPVATELGYHIQIMECDGDIYKGVRKHPENGARYESIETDKRLKEVDLANSFDHEEIRIITLTAQAFASKTASIASRESHDQYPWIATPKKGYIPIEGSKHCTFEWLDYYGLGKTREDFVETKSIKETINRNLTLNSLMEKAKSISTPIRTTRIPRSAR